MAAEIRSVSELLGMPLRIPRYQRPYRWTTKNVADLLGDINSAVDEVERHDDYRYRIGSVILHFEDADEHFDIVDGQQRILTLLLLVLSLSPETRFPLLEEGLFSDRETQGNMRANYEFISDWVGYQSDDWRGKVMVVLSDTLEVVVITVDKVEEAFQLFDSQNTRGRSLDPHDLLKAYHLRAMRGDPYGMRHVVTRWEEFSSDDVRDLFARYLFPVTNWELKEKTRPFTAKEIGAYKGVRELSGYTYAVRARRAAPCFQVGEPFVEGEDFFLMAEHYLRMREDIDLELRENPEFVEMNKMLERAKVTAGFNHAKALFLCVLFAYYDRFHNFDVRAVRKLFTWAMMIRVDMQSLGFDSINKYAVGEDNGRFTNVVPMPSIITRAREHSEVADVMIKAVPAPEGSNKERVELADFLIRLSKGGGR